MDRRINFQQFIRAVLAAIVATTVIACGRQATDDTAAGEASATTGAAGETARLAQLRNTVEALERRRTRLEDERQIKRLQHTFGFFVDRGLWNEAADLFADHGVIEFGLDGEYVGRDRVRDYLRAFGDHRDGLAEGRLNEHIQFMPVVTVADDGQRARGRWRAIIMGGELGGDAWWAEGPQENLYVKEDGVWKLERLHWFQTIAVPYEQGWMEAEDMNGGIWVSDRLEPDRPPSVPYDTWPGTFLPPFHFPNPVTGE